jgi:hypothetical protein
LVWKGGYVYVGSSSKDESLENIGDDLSRGARESLAKMEEDNEEVKSK